MIGLMAASAFYLSSLQAGIAGPTDAFRSCLRQAATKAKAEKVTADGIQVYLKNACTAQMGTLDAALIAFRMKNGMTHKAAASDAEMTVDDYISTPADNYKFLVGQDAKQVAAAPPPSATAKPVMTPAAATVPAPSQPPKP